MNIQGFIIAIIAGIWIVVDSKIRNTMQSLVIARQDNELLNVLHQPYSSNKTPNDSSNVGVVYLDFFASRDCSGDVTYSSGLRTDTCLPVSEYVRSPFSDDDFYFYNKPFDSFMITDVRPGNCSSWSIVYYYDDKCDSVYEVDQVTDYTTCKDSSSLGVSNMLSSNGNCSFSNELPISSNSYLISDYTTNCTDLPTTYTAYKVNSCFGNGNESSTIYYCDSTGYITQIQFYDSKNCTLTDFQYGHTELEIPEKCNKVRTPGVYDDDVTVDDDDDVLATTKYIENSCTIVYSSSPPTISPTMSPTDDDLISFSAVQVIDGIDIDTYNSNASLYSQTLAQSIASCMTEVSEDNIQQLVVTSGSTVSSVTSSNREARLRKMLRTFSLTVTSSDAITASYEVNVRSSDTDYSELSTELQMAVADGTFNTNLHNIASQTGATGFDNATSASVSTSNMLSSKSNKSNADDDNEGLDSGEIAGIVIGSLVFLFGILLLCYTVVAMRSKPKEPNENAVQQTQSELSTANPMVVTSKLASKILKEACVDNLNAAILAERQGADRIELCDDLDHDGLTPSITLVQEAYQTLRIPIRAMIRPKYDSFVYNEEEIEEMIESIKVFKDIGIEGVVFGCLNTDNTLDLRTIERLASECFPSLKVTIHKAIDCTPDPVSAAKSLLELRSSGLLRKDNKKFRIDAILSSGGAYQHALAGASVLKSMQAIIDNYGSTSETLELIVAGRVTQDNTAKLHLLTGARSFHGKRIVGDLSVD